MLTIVLPGNSVKNKVWAVETSKSLDIPGEILPHFWQHWEVGSHIDVKYEVTKILELVGDHSVNFIAKSIGTKVLMSVLPHIYQQINKVVLCGIPIDPLGYKKSLGLLRSEDILVIQNSKDPFMPYILIEKYIHLLNKNIKVVEKEADTHNYPYFEDFRDFLLS
jgi:poly(3-hydroxyalkanoate) synthetase